MLFCIMTGAPRLTIDDLIVEVEGERISVFLPGSHFRTVYLRTEKGLVESLQMSADSTSAFSPEEFEDIAWAAATRKAFELGWVE